MPFLLMGDINMDGNPLNSPLLFCHVQDADHIVSRVRVGELQQIAVQGHPEPVVVDGLCCHYIPRLNPWHSERCDADLFAEIGTIIKTCFARTADLKRLESGKTGVLGKTPPQLTFEAKMGGWWRRKS